MYPFVKKGEGKTLTAESNILVSQTNQFTIILFTISFYIDTRSNNLPSANLMQNNEPLVRFYVTYNPYKLSYSAADKIEEVYASLSKSSSDIYKQRSRQLYQLTPLRTKLFTWVMDNLEIVALADTSIHGKDNVVENMKDIDPDR